LRWFDHSHSSGALIFAGQELVHFFLEQPLDELLNPSLAYVTSVDRNGNSMNFDFIPTAAPFVVFFIERWLFSLTGTRPAVIDLSGRCEGLSLISIFLDNGSKEFREKRCDFRPCPANSRQRCAVFVSARFELFRRYASQ
jgi:hypothetical protein